MRSVSLIAGFAAATLVSMGMCSMSSDEPGLEPVSDATSTTTNESNDVADAGAGTDQDSTAGQTEAPPVAEDSDDTVTEEDVDGMDSHTDTAERDE